MDPRHLRSGRPLFHLVPNLLTITGLCAGLTGMRYAFDERWQLAVALVVAAAVFDGLDGRSARLLKITSPLGEQLDSLADFVSFGVVPAVILYLWVLSDVRAVGWALVMLFATCCALRLARFNVELSAPKPDPSVKAFFTGVPAPAGAGIALLPMIGSFVLDDAGLAGSILQSWLLSALFIVFSAVMMISRVPTFSVKQLRIHPHNMLWALVVGVFVLVFFITLPWLTLSLIGLLYLAALPMGVLTAKRMAAGKPMPRGLPGLEMARHTSEAEDIGKDEPPARPRDGL